jgi:hypothetical protein
VDIIFGGIVITLLQTQVKLCANYLNLKRNVFVKNFLASFKANNVPYMAHVPYVCRQCSEELNKIV